MLRYEEVEIGMPGPGEARVKHTAIGLNFTGMRLPALFHPSSV
jgi:NADPH:quinone reductase